MTVIGAGSRGAVTSEIPTSSNPEHTFNRRKLRLCLPEAKTVQKPTAWQTKTTQKVAYRIFSPAHYGTCNTSCLRFRQRNGIRTVKCALTHPCLLNTGICGYVKPGSCSSTIKLSIHLLNIRDTRTCNGSDIRITVNVDTIRAGAAINNITKVQCLTRSCLACDKCIVTCCALKIINSSSERTLL